MAGVPVEGLCNTVVWLDGITCYAAGEEESIVAYNWNCIPGKHKKKQISLSTCTVRLILSSWQSLSEQLLTAMLRTVARPSCTQILFKVLVSANTYRVLNINNLLPPESVVGITATVDNCCIVRQFYNCARVQL